MSRPSEADRRFWEALRADLERVLGDEDELEACRIEDRDGRVVAVATGAFRARSFRIEAEGETALDAYRTLLDRVAAGRLAAAFTDVIDERSGPVS